ncbi:MAG: histidine kinase [Rikenellaceae bacterium]
MTQERKMVFIEYFAIMIVWLAITITPILFGNDFSRNWGAIYVFWAEFSVVAIAFLINRFILMPKLFYKNKYREFSYSIVTLFILIFIFVSACNGIELILSIFGIEDYHPVSRNGMQNPGFDNYPHFTHKSRNPLPVIPPSFNVLIYSAIVVILDIGINIAVRWTISERRSEILKSENINAQLQKLQSQVSPHFFMNTLNNIHALVEIDPQRAQETIIELSGLMDYLLYETSTKKMVNLENELAFINSYVKLMQLRYPKRIIIECKAPEILPRIEVPPLLFLNFIENSFKYGVDYAKDSYIKINFSITEDFVNLLVVNSNHSASVTRKRTGLGLQNSRKRLELLYGRNFQLDIDNNLLEYSVNLKIPIK